MTIINFSNFSHKTRLNAIFFELCRTNTSSGAGVEWARWSESFREDIYFGPNYSSYGNGASDVCVCVRTCVRFTKISRSVQFAKPVNLRRIIHVPLPASRVRDVTSSQSHRLKVSNALGTRTGRNFKYFFLRISFSNGYCNLFNIFYTPVRSNFQQCRSRKGVFADMYTLVKLFCGDWSRDPMDSREATIKNARLWRIAAVILNSPLISACILRKYCISMP